MFCALAVTVKRSIMHYFYLGGADLEGRSGSFRSFGLCFCV